MPNNLTLIIEVKSKIIDYTKAKQYFCNRMAVIAGWGLIPDKIYPKTGEITYKWANSDLQNLYKKIEDEMNEYLSEHYPDIHRLAMSGILK